MIIPTILVQLFLLIVYSSWIWIPLIAFLIWNRKRKKKESEKQEKESFERFANKFTIGKNQKFLKCHFIPKNSKFTNAGFDSDFKVHFSKETICFNAKGFAVMNDGQIIPKITETWCESHNPPLSEDETNRFFEYVVEHDAQFLEILKLCLAQP